MKLRDYQEDFLSQAIQVIDKYCLVYLQGEPRVGKTIVSMHTANHVKSENVLFITKKKAISSVLNDYKESGFNYGFTCTNYEQAHKLEGEFDTIIIDEAHNYSTYPKPSLRYKNIYKRTRKAKYLIFLSATPTPESYSQIFHQFHLSINSPWAKYKTFYQWAKDYTEEKFKFFNGIQTKDYSGGIKDKILPEIDKYFVRYTQKKAGFKTVIKEEFIDIKMRPLTYKLIDQLKKERIIEGKTGAIIADTGGKLNQKCHQLYSGTVKLEDGTGVILDDSKAMAIHQIEGKKAIYYKFKQEREMLIKEFGSLITEDAEEFQEQDELIFISQVISGREGVKLDTADCLIMFNIDFSYLSYRQTMDRIQSFDREKEPRLIWLFSEDGIEKEIYHVVKNLKENFTYDHFKMMDNTGQQDLIL
jgi:KaiC/GvpD/RAD55 family RecA-like ATPase